MSIAVGHISTDLRINTRRHMHICICRWHPATPLTVQETCHTTNVSTLSDGSAPRTTCFRRDARRLKGRLAKRGYPLSLIDSAITKVSSISHTNSQYHSKRQTTHRTPLVTTHNPGDPAHWQNALNSVCQFSTLVKIEEGSPIATCSG